MKIHSYVTNPLVTTKCASLKHASHLAQPVKTGISLKNFGKKRSFGLHYYQLTEM